MKVYHCTTSKKAKKYKESGKIIAPVRAFNTLQAAMLWCMHTMRNVIYEMDFDSPQKLPDHHNQFGKAFWNSNNIPYENIKCIVSVENEFSKKEFIN